VSFKPLPLYLQGNRSRQPLSRTVDGPQSRSGRCTEEKKSHCPFQETNPGRPTRSPSLYRLSYPRTVLERLGGIRNLTIWITGVPAEIRTEHLQNTRLERCRYASSFGGSTVLLRSHRLKYVKQFIMRSILHTGEYHEI
jgi:hypothetical protein